MTTEGKPNSPGKTISLSGRNISISELKEKLKLLPDSGKVALHSDKLPEDRPAPTRPEDKEHLGGEYTRQDLIELVQSLPENKISKAFKAVAQIADSKLPVVAPALWKDRADRITAVEFYDLHWAKFAGKGLTRNLIRQLDRTYYYTLSKWLSRQDESSIPENMKVLFDNPSDRVEAELVAANIVDPKDAHKAFPDDPKTADRLYQASWIRQPK